MNLLKNLLLYISAFVPMYALIFVKLVVEIINNNLSFNILNSLNFSTLLLLILLGLFGLYWNVWLNKEQSKEITIIEKQNITDQHFLGYFSLFVFFAIPLDLSLVSGFMMYVFIIVLIGIVYINNGLYYINPLLNILGYNFYDISYKIKGEDKLRKTKIFYKGDLKIERRSYFVKLKNENFSFVDSGREKSRKKTK